MQPTHNTRGQLILFPVGTSMASTARASRVERKARELDRLAETAEREMAEGYLAGNTTAAQAAHDRARGARRAAELLRAGPAGVARVLGRSAA